MTRPSAWNRFPFTDGVSAVSSVRSRFTLLRFRFGCEPQRSHKTIGTIGKRIASAKAAITSDALSVIVEKTKGYPYFLQEWGSHAWNVAKSSPITADDARAATSLVLKSLDKGFFRVRLDRLTPREKDYMRAMAALGPGPHRSGEIAQKLGIAVTNAGPLRDGLIKKGMVYSPQHGDTAFTVPMFDDFMRRSLPDWTPGTPVGADPRKPSSPKKRGL